MVALVDASGGIVERYSYSPFGLTSIDDGSGTPRTSSAYGNRFMYAGQRFDHEAGLYHMRARVYSPRLGRFLQRDAAVVVALSL